MAVYARKAGFMLTCQTQRISQICFEYLKYCQACNYAKGTIQFYKEKLERFIAYSTPLQVINMDQITPDHIRGFVITLQPDHTEGGVHAFYRSLRAFLNWYEFEYEPENWKNPIKKVRAPRVPEKLLDPVSNDTVEKLIEACRESDYGIRDKAIILFLISTGARASEILALNRDDVDLNSCAALVRSGKGGYFRFIFFDSDTRKALKKYLKTRDDDHKALWISRYQDRLNYDGLRGIVTRLAEKAGIEAPPLHAFRRAFAVNLLNAKIPDQTIIQLMGQHSIAALRPYTKMSKELLQLAYQSSKE